MIGSLVLGVLHIAGAALWFGGVLSIAPIVRRSLGFGRDVQRSAATLAYRFGWFSGVGTLLSCASGVALIFSHYGGFKGLPPRFHIALTLSILALLNAFLLLIPTLSRLKAHAGEEGARTKTEDAVKRLSLATAFSHLFWFISLILMFARSWPS